MMDDPIPHRYARALFEAAMEADQIDETLEHLSLIAQVLRESPDAKALLLNPDVEPHEKVAVWDRALRGLWSDRLRAFVHVVVSFGRAEFLDGIAEAFSAAVDEEKRRLRAVVRSAHALPAPVLERLHARLETLERKQVLVHTELDPALLGGLQIVLDHRVIDSSVRRQLVELRQQLKSVRVH